MRLELSQGRLIVMSPAGLKHGELTSLLNYIIAGFVREHELGITTGAETGFILHQDPDGKDTVRAPDVGFITAARVPDPLPDGFAPFAPDLAIEVISPNDDAEEIHQKVMEYLQYGTRMVILFYPKSRTAAVYTPSGYETFGIEDTLDGRDVLPGFELPLRKVFG
jgi:Uma2 family endonuclease